MGDAFVGERLLAGDALFVGEALFDEKFVFDGTLPGGEFEGSGFGFLEDFGGAGVAAAFAFGADVGAETEFFGPNCLIAMTKFAQSFDQTVDSCRCSD